MGEMARSSAKLPRLLSEALWEYARNFRDKTFLDSLTRLGQALPIGLFDNDPIRHYLEKIWSIKGRTDDFRRLGKRLVVVATDLDSGKAARFGEPGLDHIPISRAVQASSALPGLYPPVEIEGRHYVDGVLLKTLHASVALEAGAELVICVNPIVPVDMANAVEAGSMGGGELLSRGLPTVLAQTFRTLVHSRLEVGLAAYEHRFEDRDVVLIEPRRDDYKMFFTNIFGLAERREVCEHAYQTTRGNLLERYDELAPILARHGVTLRKDVLLQTRSLWDQVALPDRNARTSTSNHATVRQLDDVLSRLEKLVGGMEPA
jgi:NTE family protein